MASRRFSSAPTTAAAQTGGATCRPYLTGRMRATRWRTSNGNSDVRRTRKAFPVSDLTENDKREIRKFMRFLRRRTEKPDEPLFHAYAEQYGEVVFEDKSAQAPGKEQP
jgi:hypothetical protein